MNGLIRHCALCLHEIHNPLLCIRCYRRAYCSKLCQAADWLPRGAGQGHKMWCELDCGEEDLDWECREENGELTVFSKRFIPARSRIMVEAVYTDPNDHAGIKDLKPLDCKTLKKKFDLNSMVCGQKERGVSLRISRVSHSCDPNCSHFYHENENVRILYSQKDIEVGEKLTINFYDWRDLNQSASPEQVRMILELNWSIKCTSDCKCRDEAVSSHIRHARQRLMKIQELLRKEKYSRVLKESQELIKFHEIIGSDWILKAQTYWLIYQAALQCRNRMKAEIYLKLFEDIQSDISLPRSHQALLNRKKLGL